MTRPLPPEFNTAIQTDNFSWILLADYEFDSGTVYLSTDTVDHTVNSNLYKGVGANGPSVSGSVETTQGTDSRVKMGLSGINISGVPSFMDEITTNPVTGRAGRFYLAVLNNVTKQIDGDPLLIFNGFMDSPLVKEKPQRAIGLDLVSAAARLVKRLGYKLTSDHQQKIWPGDTGLDYVADLDDEIRWGSADSLNVAPVGSSSSFTPTGKFGTTKNLA